MWQHRGNLIELICTTQFHSGTTVSAQSVRTTDKISENNQRLSVRPPNVKTRKRK